MTAPPAKPKKSRKNDTAANMMAMPRPTNASLRTPPPPSEKMMVTPAITMAIQSVISVAELIVVPTRPSPHDLRAVGSTVDLAQAAGRPFAVAVTQAKPTARLTVQAVAALSAHGAVAPAIVHDRVDYAASMVDGRTVSETDSKSRSAEEMRQLLSFVLERLHVKTKNKKKETV